MQYEHAMTHTCFLIWLVSNNAYSLSCKSAETNYYVTSIVWHNFKEVALIHNTFYDTANVIWLVRGMWNDVVKSRQETITSAGEKKETNLVPIVLITSQNILGSIVVSIPACHAGDRGSIPRQGVFLFYFIINFFVIIKLLFFFNFILPRI